MMSLRVLTFIGDAGDPRTALHILTQSVAGVQVVDEVAVVAEAVDEDRHGVGVRLVQAFLHPDVRDDVIALLDDLTAIRAASLEDSGCGVALRTRLNDFIIHEDVVDESLDDTGAKSDLVTVSFQCHLVRSVAAEGVRDVSLLTEVSVGTDNSDAGRRSAFLVSLVIGGEDNLPGSVVNRQQHATRRLVWLHLQQEGSSRQAVVFGAVQLSVRAWLVEIPVDLGGAGASLPVEVSSLPADGDPGSLGVLTILAVKRLSWYDRDLVGSTLGLGQLVFTGDLNPSLLLSVRGQVSFASDLTIPCLALAHQDSQAHAQQAFYRQSHV